MNRPVVVPLSPFLFTPHQIPHLTEIARRSDAAFRILDLTSPVTDEKGEPPSGMRSRNELLAHRVRTAHRSYLGSVVEQLEAVVGTTRIRGDQREGEVLPALSAYAREEQAALIVIGRNDDEDHPVHPLRRAGKHLVRTSGCPVFLLLTKKGAACGTLLSPMDGSPTARAGLELALCAAHACGAQELTLQAVKGVLSDDGRSGSGRPPIEPPGPLQ